jgi:small subunit ribosomal protein S21
MAELVSDFWMQVFAAGCLGSELIRIAII